MGICFVQSNWNGEVFISSYRRGRLFVLCHYHTSCRWSTIRHTIFIHGDLAQHIEQTVRRPASEGVQWKNLQAFPTWLRISSAPHIIIIYATTADIVERVLSWVNWWLHAHVMDSYAHWYVELSPDYDWCVVAAAPCVTHMYRLINRRFGAMAQVYFSVDAI